MSSHTVVWDIETGPLAPEFLDMIAPTFEPPGNYKDPEKIAANLAEQKLKWVDRAALSPLTGRVICIGMRDIDGSIRVLDGAGDEKALLMEWCRIVQDYRNETFIGFNTRQFDVPFLVKRCWKHGVTPFLRPGVDLRRLPNWIDLRDIWQLGDKQAEGSLDAIAKFMGMGTKTGPGKDFYKLWENDRDAAILYSQNDVQLTMAIAERMGVMA